MDGLCDICEKHGTYVCKPNRRDMFTCENCGGEFCAECLEKMAKEYGTEQNCGHDYDETARYTCYCGLHGWECPKCYEGDEVAALDEVEASEAEASAKKAAAVAS